MTYIKEELAPVLEEILYLHGQLRVLKFTFDRMVQEIKEKANLEKYNTEIEISKLIPVEKELLKMHTDLIQTACDIQVSISTAMLNTSVNTLTVN